MANNTKDEVSKNKSKADANVKHHKSSKHKINNKEIKNTDKKPKAAKPEKKIDKFGKNIVKSKTKNQTKEKKADLSTKTSENSNKKIIRGQKLVLKCSNVTKKSNGGLRILRDCSFSAYRGEAVAILAPAENSKSVFAKIICGLVHPSNGQVTIRGNKAGRATNQFVSYQPEVPFVKNESTVSDLMNIYSRFFSDFDFRYSFRLLKQFKISPKTKFSHLSGTAIQIVETILVASRKTSLYVFDDPLVHTDPKYRSALIDIIGECKKFGAVVIFSEVVDDIDKIADKVIMLKRGEVYIALNSDEYKGSNRLLTLYKEVFRRNA